MPLERKNTAPLSSVTPLGERKLWSAELLHRALHRHVPREELMLVQHPHVVARQPVGGDDCGAGDLI